MQRYAKAVAIAWWTTKGRARSTKSKHTASRQARKQMLEFVIGFWVLVLIIGTLLFIGQLILGFFCWIGLGIAGLIQYFRESR